MRDAQLHTITLYQPAGRDPVWDYLEATRVIHRGGVETSEHWFIYLEASHYDTSLGLVAPEASALWVI